MDLPGIASLFFEPSKRWTESKVVRLENLDTAVEEEPEVKRLKAQGHAVQLVNEDRLRRLAKDGWKPVTERDAIGRPTIFMYRLEELLLVHRVPGEPEASR